ncbi:MAG: hypothetical protein WCW54_02480 [Candidatus Paceibacterota bacterium]
MKINQIKEKLNKIVESKNFIKIIYILGAVFIFALIFQAGMMVGFRKASFSRDWGNNYERNFGPNREIPRFLRDGMRDIPNANGAIGQIIKVEFPNITVLDKDQTEKVVIIKDDTNILERKDIVSKENLKVDQFIIVIGSPNGNGQIEAKLIRIMPNPEEMIKLNMNGFNSKNI